MESEPRIQKEEKPEAQLCRMSIMFPVDNDEEAIDIKKAISACVVSVPNVRMEFGLVTMPKVPEQKKGM